MLGRSRLTRNRLTTSVGSARASFPMILTVTRKIPEPFIILAAGAVGMLVRGDIR